VPALGIDTLLGALAYGASQVVLLANAQEANEYGPAVEKQCAMPKPYSARWAMPACTSSCLHRRCGRAGARSMGARAGRGRPPSGGL